MTEWDPALFHFLRPWWLLGLVPAVGIAVRYHRRHGSTNGWRARIDPSLLTALLDDVGAQHRTALAVLIGLALTLASIAMAGPTFSRLPQPVEQRNEALVVVLDLSLSMLVADTPPSRIVRARHKITDLLELQDEGFVGLVAYAGDAHVVSPLTDDTRTIANLLSALTPEMMPVLGSRPGDAVELARSLLDNAGVSQGRIILVTDGIERISDVTSHASRQVPISILAIGTERGAPIPLDFVDQPGQVLRDDQGRPVIARVDFERLQAVTEISHGRFAELAVGDQDLEHLLNTPLPRAAETVEVERQFDTWADVGYWLAIGLLPFAMLAFRRGVLVGLVLVVASPADASWWDDLWQRPDQQGYAALQGGEPERAAALFEDPRWQGIAHYRSDAYERAAREFRADPSADGHYNSGNALAHLGQLEEAIAAYDRALALQPDHEDAAFNKALLERQQQQQQQQQQQSSGGQEGAQNEQPPAGAPRSPEDRSDGGTGQDPAASDPPPDPQEQQEGDGSSDQGEQVAEAEPKAPEQRDELDDAVEQWLRRVPDDPGGLLRRKFQYETNQRLRRGEYRSSRQERIW